MYSTVFAFALSGVARRGQVGERAPRGGASEKWVGGAKQKNWNL